jgi:transcriptional regulator with GAF, ATPase, and Fis domain
VTQVLHLPDSGELALAALIGQSPAIEQLRATVRRVARSDLPVLILGPSGAGKELVAQALHAVSGRRGRWVPFNVCAIPESTFESAVFGHVRGAFTGATADHPGYLVEADGGTAFFDEIGGLAGC